MKIFEDNNKYFFLPAQFEKLISPERALFDIWAGIYYLASLNGYDAEFRITAYMLNKEPFKLTSLKYTDLKQAVSEICQKDSAVRMETIGEKKQETLMITVEKPGDGFKVPVEFVSKHFTGSLMLPNFEDKASVLFLFREYERSKEEKLRVSPDEFNNFLRLTVTNRPNPALVLDRLSGLDILKFEKPRSGRKLSVKLTWEKFVSEYSVRKLRIKAGKLKGEIGRIYDRLCRDIKNEKTTGHTDYLIIATALNEIIGRFDEVKFLPDDILESLQREYFSRGSRGRYTLRNSFSESLAESGIQSFWCDFSLNEHLKVNSKKMSINPGNYRNFMIIHYFYPGSLIKAKSGEFKYSFRIDLDCNKALDVYNTGGQHSFVTSFDDKVLNACRGAIVCTLPGQKNIIDEVTVNVNSGNNLSKLNVRAFVALK